MFTLFFAGQRLRTPERRWTASPCRSTCSAITSARCSRLAERLAGIDATWPGYDTMNEPLGGVHRLARPGRAPLGRLTLGDCPTPFQSMLLGDGIPQEVDIWEIPFAWRKRTGTRRVNAGGQRAWQAGAPCVWRQNGVWDVDAAGHPHLLRPGLLQPGRRPGGGLRGRLLCTVRREVCRGHLRG